MAAPVPSFVQLPLDSGNAGKKVQTDIITVGADQVHRHHYVREMAAEVLGVYGAASALQSVAAAAQNGTTTGFAWMHVPTAVSGKAARIRKIEVSHGISAATPTMPTTPRIGLTRFTFTGTASGAALAATLKDSAYPAAILDIRTAVTGLTPALVPGATSAIASSLVPAFLLSGTVADILWCETVMDDMVQPSEEDGFLVIRPGQGFVLWQMDAGTTGDIRRFTFETTWDEIDTA
jgi:hypothetical protein